MIKGVSKKVLEINNPQSLYFEKAVLYLKPNLSSISYKLLRAEAEEMLKDLSPKSQRKVSFKHLVISLLITCTVLCGFFVGYFLFFN